MVLTSMVIPSLEWPRGSSSWPSLDIKTTELPQAYSAVSGMYPLALSVESSVPSMHVNRVNCTSQKSAFLVEAAFMLLLCCSCWMSIPQITRLSSRGSRFSVKEFRARANEIAPDETIRKPTRTVTQRLSRPSLC